jgi:hypothetical protein
MRPLFRSLLILLAFVAAACAGAGSRSTDGPRSSYDVLLQEDIRASGQTNLLAALTALRPNWLQPRGTDSFRSPTPVQVYRDDMRLGGVETLRAISVTEISSVRYFDGIAAAARWGFDHSQGAILVLSLPR